VLTIVVVVVLLSALLTAFVVLGRGWSLRRQALQRLYANPDQGGPADESEARSETPLGRWLARAGYRRANAQTVFLTATLGSVGAGLVVSQIYRLLLFQPLVNAVAGIPGSAGDVLVIALQGGPWLLFLISSLGPTLYVRNARRARVESVEQDLPLALELFATMAEAGLGFDAALTRIVRAQGPDRALTSELLNFQHDMLAGMSRTQAMRQLAKRVDVPSLTSFASALIQAEQVGASLAETLQYQAVDLRQRRRENALLQAQALPVKLVFPLVVCFLPGIFVSTLAPVLYQMVQVAGSVIQGSGR